jgi:bifunctional DNase/RNase
MKLVELKIKGISYSETQSGAYALILSEVNGNRKLPIIIGGYEAQAIAIGLEKEIKPSRPLTHDLFEEFANTFEIKIQKVIIHKLVDGVFFSNIICESNHNENSLDARTSDAIALAVRFKIPVFTYESILKIAGFSSKKITKTDDCEDIIINTDKNSKKNILPNNLENISMPKLKILLKKLVTDEEYEKAARIRDLISKKSHK